MKITLKRTEEQLELIKAMASKNRDVAYQAQVALAEFIGPVLAKVVNQAPTLSNLFTNFSYNADESPSIPMDLYYDITDEDYATVWSQSVAGGLPTNTVTPIGGEMKFTTYRLDSAVDFDKRYAQRSRMDVVSKSFTRIAQEILLKQERNSAALIMGALADAKTKGRDHTIVSRDTADATAGPGAGNGTSRLILDDFNKLLTLGKRINTAWTGGTAEGGLGGRGVTDLICSPEIVQGLREMAYNPINTRSVGGGNDIAATDSMREAIYSNAGIPEFYGISIMELQEMGKGQRFNKVFATLDNHASRNGTDPFNDTDNELVLGLDKGKESMLRAIASDSETGSEFSLLADDQYSVRQSKIGYYGSIEEGRMILDNRVLFGIIA
jgi:hypothetical protein